MRRRTPAGRPYWETPDDHYHRGTPSFVRALGGESLALERAYGLSLMWLFPGWGKLLAGLPERVAGAAFRALDAIARRQVALSDTIISVWKKP